MTLTFQPLPGGGSEREFDVLNTLEFALNRRRARELGVDIPASMLIEAKELYD